MIRRSLPLLMILAASLAGCGGTPADEALSRMHDTIIGRLSSSIGKMPAEGPSRSTAKLHLTTERGMEGPLVGTADITVNSEVATDVRNAKSPIVDGTVSISAVIGTPAGTFSGVPSSAKNAPEETVSADFTVSARTVERTLLLQIGSVLVSGPFLPQPFKLPEEFGTRWYGMTFAEIDKLLADRAKENDTPPTPPLDQLITQAFHSRTNPRAVRELVSGIHFWKGIELLPEENGMVRIRVESDKEKIQAGVHALVTYLHETSGQAWETQLRTNPDLQNQLRELESDDSEFMKTMGSVKGVLSADSQSYEFMGFDGDIADESGALTGHITIMRTKDGDAHVSLKTENTGDLFVFDKKGSDVTATFNDHPVLSGTVSATEVKLTANDPETGKVAVSVSFHIKSLSRTSGSITDGVVTIPSKNMIIRIGEFAADVLENGAMTMHLDAKGELEGRKLFSVTADTERQPVASVTAEKPTYRPLKGLYQDLMPLVIGAASGQSPEKSAE